MNAAKYWRSFEYVSLEVLSIILSKEIGPLQIEERDVTQRTRDQGVDGYIRFRAATISHTYTVEAKLRSEGPISLRDIATSILYFLISKSDGHFIVTNVTFTAETLRVLQVLREQKSACLEVVDGYDLRNYLNEGLSVNEDGVSELLAWLKAKPLPEQEENRPLKAERFLLVQDHVDVPSRVEIRQRILKCISAEKKLIIVHGERGTGKTQLIEDVIRHVSKSSYKIYRLNMSALPSPRFFVLQLLQIVTGVDVRELVDLLSASEQENVAEDVVSLAGSLEKEYGNAIRCLLTREVCHDTTADYLMRRLLDELSAQYFRLEQGLVIVEGLENSEPKMVQYFQYILDILTDSRNSLAVIVELPILRSAGESGKISLNEWESFSEGLRHTRANGQEAELFRLTNYEEVESVRILKSCIPESFFSLEYANAVLAWVGTNPGTLFSAIWLIRSAKLFALYDIDHLILKSQVLSSHEAYLEALLTDSADGRFFHRAFSVCCDLDGRLPFPVFRLLGKEYGVPIKKLTDTGLFRSTRQGLEFQNRYTAQALTALLDICYRQEDRRWLLNVSDTAIPGKSYRKGKQVWLRLKLGELVPGDEIATTLKAVTEDGMGSLTDAILLNAYQLCEEEKYCFLALKYLLHYLSQPQMRDKYNTPENSNLLDKMDLLVAELAFANTPIPLVWNIKRFMIRYWSCKAMYDYQGCIHYTEEILQLEPDPPLQGSTLERYFVQAHEFQALNQKEQGNWVGFIRAFRIALRKYPDNKGIRISCYMNIAAYFYHRGPKTASAFLGRALEMAEAINGTSNSQWLWLYNDQILCDLFARQGDWDDILMARKTADHCYSLANLARTFNFEGCWHFDRKELVLALDAFIKASNLGITQGQDKPSFLFLTNVIAVKLLCGQDAGDDLNRAGQWLFGHFDTVSQKIARNSGRMFDHLFTAVTSWLVSVRKAKQTEWEKAFRKRWKQAAPSLTWNIFDINNIHDDFLRRETIIVLF